MQRKLFAKLGIIALMSLALLIPLSMIEAQIAARSARQAEVAQDIADTAAGPQTLTGPVLAVRYRERITRRDRNAATGVESVQREIVERTMVLPPQRLAVNGDAAVETRQRGLYRARLFHLDARLDGHFAIAERLGLAADRELIDARAYLVLGVADPRGVDNDPELRVNGRPYRFATGNADALAGAGLNVELGEIALDRTQRLDFDFTLALTGSGRLAIAPAGEATTVTLRSPWPHPSFQGRFLPLTRSVGERGFEAQWQVSHLARDFKRVLAAGEGDGGRPEALAVSFVEPVSIYLKSERAVKYGVLFVVLTFAAFFLTEVLRRLPIHPLQYLLVGLALAVFFLLLVALSEHLAFGLAYALSAAACVLLIGAYLAGALGSLHRGAAFAAAIATLYTVLYGVLLSEDNALLMGALLIFAALGATMLATRRIDWYRLGGGRAEA